MCEFLGYIVYNTTNLYSAHACPDSFGGGPYLKWPLCDEEAENFKRELRANGKDYLLIEDSLPCDLYPRGLVISKEFVCLYMDYCRGRGIDVRLLAYATDAEVFQTFPWYTSMTILGYDCVSTYSLCSYLYWDNPSASFSKKMVEKHILLNEYGYLATKSDADRYGNMRREVLNQGEDIEDLGEELSVAVAIVLAFS